jgi:hypothetical protein
MIAEQKININSGEGSNLEKKREFKYRLAWASRHVIVG